MKLLFFCISSALGIPPVDPLAGHQFPKVQEIRTAHNRSILWIERTQNITELEIFFEQGGERDHKALLWVEKYWKKEQHKYSEELLRIGAYLRFSMRNHSAFIQIAVPKGGERRALSIIKTILTKIPSKFPADPVISTPAPWELSQLLLREPHKSFKPQQTYSNKEKQRAYRRWMRRAQPRFIIVSSEIDKRFLKALDYFWPKAKEPAQHYSFREKEYQWTPQKILVDSPLGTQADIFLYIPLPKGNHYAQVFFNSILGGHFSARLSLRLRQELGLAYSASSSIRQLSSLSYLELSVRASHHDIPLIYQELYRIVLGMRKIEPQEFQTAKSQMLIKDRLRSANGRHLLAWLRYHDDFQDWITFAQKRQSLELRDVYTSMSGFFRGGRNIWIIHAPIEQLESLKKGNWHILSEQ